MTGKLKKLVVKALQKVGSLQLTSSFTYGQERYLLFSWNMKHPVTWIIAIFQLPIYLLFCLVGAAAVFFVSMGMDTISITEENEGYQGST